jgi:hypothetical protein
MRVLPKTLSSRISFLETHLTVWAADPGAVGLTGAEITALQGLLAEASAASLAAHEARNAARAATFAMNVAGRRMTAATSGAIGRIKVAAAADSEVYIRAQIPVPDPMSTTPAPATPTRFACALRTTGGLELSWDCKNPRGTQGTMYEITRRIVGVAGAEGFTFAGVVGEKSFVDDTVPAGATSVEYQVTAIRSTHRGAPARFGISLGVQGLSSFANAPARLAA